MWSRALLHLGEAGGVLRDKFMVQRIAPHQRGEDRAQQERVGARTHRKMQIGHLGGFGAARIDHDQLAAWILPDPVQMVARIREAVRDPGIRADHEQQVAVVDVLGGVAGLAAEHMTVDPEVAGLLLRQRIEHVARAERAQESGRIGAAGMIALAAAAIERDGSCRHGDRPASRRRAAISPIAVSQSISSKPPSGRRRSGDVSRSR